MLQFPTKLPPPPFNRISEFVLQKINIKISEKYLSKQIKVSINGGFFIRRTLWSIFNKMVHESVSLKDFESLL